MPIYAYRCSACGYAKDVLQKMSDPLLTVCPACGAASFQKQVTAAGFQLKGSGWYVTDFRGGDTKGGAKADTAEGAEAAKGVGDGAPAGEGGGAKPEAKPAEAKAGDGKAEAKPAAPAPATPAAAPPSGAGSK